MPCAGTPLVRVGGNVLLRAPKVSRPARRPRCSQQAEACPRARTAKRRGLPQGWTRDFFEPPQLDRDCWAQRAWHYLLLMRLIDGACRAGSQHRPSSLDGRGPAPQPPPRCWRR
jgi:hypothetical protein